MKIPWKREHLLFFFKTIIVMKILLLFCAFNFLHASTVLSQQVNFRMKNASLDQVLLRLSKEVNFDLVFDSKIFSGQKKRDVNFNKTTVKHALTELFNNSPFTYEVINKVIVVRKKEVDKIPKVTAIRQQRKIKGQVTDNNNTPLSAVTVGVKNSQIASSTDTQGHFEIEIPNDN